MEAQMRIPENATSAEFESARRWQDLGAPGSRAELYDQKARETAQDYARNIEAYIGTVSVPVGIAGPIRIIGKSATRDYRVPLATTEAALVASYNRGAGLISAAGGCNARVVSAGVSRTPMFAFSNIVEASLFADFVDSSIGRMQAIVPQVTRFGRLQAVRTIIEGNHVYLELSFTTGDAAGQNMVTFATDAVLEFILDSAPVRPRYWFLEANLSGDKKATGSCLTGVRGKRVIADVVLPRELIETALHTPPECMVEYWSAGAIGGVMSGATGIHGHYANGLAALFLACGQDVACVAEAASGITRLEMSDDDHLYASVTLPNVIVGTVGGGTSLPSARACLDLLGLAGPGHSEAFAEVCASIVLAGELSIIGAFCSGDFADAHRALSRGQPEHLERNNV